MKALVLDGKVVDVAEEEFPVHSDLVWVDCPSNVLAGWDYKNGEFVDTTPVVDKLEELREQRNEKLSETDHWALSDVTLSDEMREYRQALRDITDTYQTVEEVVWPEKP